MSLPVHFVTVAHNAEPWIQHHIDVFKKLRRPWTWSVCEGVTPCPWAGTITADMHHEGLSTDGTHEYLEHLDGQFPNVKLYRNDTYLTEKFQLMLADVKDAESLVWQVDADEFWTAEQIERMAAMFERYPYHAAAWFYCRFFVGPNLVLARGNGNSAGNMAYEWVRVWRWRPECRYVKHDPPEVATPVCANIAKAPAAFFSREVTAAEGLVFDHHAFEIPAQVQYKETRYGFQGALERWRLLQTAKLPVDVYDYLPWLGHGMVERCAA